MLSTPTTTISTFRGTTTDIYGDPQDTTTVYLSKVPCSLIEQTRVVQTQDNPQPVIVRIYKATVNGRTDVAVGDRVLDERSGLTYIIDSFWQPQNPNFVSDLHLGLRRVT